MLVRAKVDFQKPNISELRAKGMTLVDMHVHTQYSDTYVQIQRLLTAASKLKIGMAITDHNEIRGVLETMKKKDGHLIIPGIEVTCRERCHMLVYFYLMEQLKDFYYNHVAPCKEKNPFSVTSLKTCDLLKHTSKYDCIVCAAHPFSPGFTGIYKNIRRGYLPKSTINRIDVIEVMNGINTKKANWKALEWAEDTKKSFVGGSDAHSLFELGKVLTYSDASTVKGFLDRVLEKQNFVIGKQLGLIAHMPCHSNMLGRHLRYIRPTIKMRYDVSLKPSVKYHVPRIKKKIKTKINHAKVIGVVRVRNIAARTRKRIDYKFERQKG